VGLVDNLSVVAYIFINSGRESTRDKKRKRNGMDTNTERLPDSLEELNALRVATMSNYIVACENEQEQNDDEDYSTPGNSTRLMAELKTIDAKIRSIPKPAKAAKPEIDMDNPMTWPPLASPEVTVEMAYRRGQIMSGYPGGLHPDAIDAHGFISDITRAYRQGWTDAINSNNAGE
jgi:hypothetical protein